MLLEHALAIRAQENYEAVIVAMAPHIKKSDRRKLLDQFKELIDGTDKPSSAIIKRDRERLQKLLFNKKNA